MRIELRKSLVSVTPVNLMRGKNESVICLTHSCYLKFLIIPLLLLLLLLMYSLLAYDNFTSLERELANQKSISFVPVELKRKYFNQAFFC